MGFNSMMKPQHMVVAMHWFIPDPFSNRYDKLTHLSSLATVEHVADQTHTVLWTLAMRRDEKLMRWCYHLVEHGYIGDDDPSRVARIFMAPCEASDGKARAPAELVSFVETMLAVEDGVTLDGQNYQPFKPAQQLASWQSQPRVLDL